MEDSRVRIAVITPTTENTPIAIPRRVKDDLSLLVRMELNAILRLSERVFFRWECFFISFYSYRSASIGSKPAARNEGPKPERIPTTVLKVSEITAREIGMVEGKIKASITKLPE